MPFAAAVSGAEAKAPAAMAGVTSVTEL
jgi:hypothetical protein